MTELAQRLAAIRARIEGACVAAGRDPASVTLVGAAKGQPLEKLRAAAGLGLTDMGHNYAQEFRDTVAALATDPACADLRWHFIGHLQSNKIKYLVGKVALWHTLDDVGLAQAFSDRSEKLGAVTTALLEVNIGDEQSKTGVAASQAVALAEKVAALGGVKLAGVMVMPPPAPVGADPLAFARPYFATARELAADLHRLGLLPALAPGETPRLSMGMSGDFEAAIAEGATHVRVGTALFGPRG